MLFLRAATDDDIGLLARMNKQLIDDEGHRNPMTMPELAGRMREWLHNEWNADFFMDASFDRPTGHAKDLDAYRERLSFFVLGERVLAELRQPPYGDRAVVLKESGRLIGSVGLVPCLAPFGQFPFFGGTKDAKFSAEVGLFYAIAPEHRRHGVASEAAAAIVRFAFDELNLRRVLATTWYENAASSAVMRRIGMTVQHNPWPTPPWFQVVGVLEI